MSGWRAHPRRQISSILTWSSTVHRSAAGLSADDLDGLDVDRERTVVESLAAAVVVAKAPHKGTRWSPDR